MENVSYLSLGTNIGDKLDNLKCAINHLSSCENINVIEKSYIYESEPLYNLNQDKFFNIVLKIRTSLLPLELLSSCQKIEKNMGRQIETKKNSPRIIDIDILLYNKEKINTKQLVIPHADMLNRKFVLLPLYDVDPNIILSNNKNIKDILTVVNDSSNIVKLNQLNL